jgi:hypothetical protein
LGLLQFQKALLCKSAAAKTVSAFMASSAPRIQHHRVLCPREYPFGYSDGSGLRIDGGWSCETLKFRKIQWINDFKVL